MNKIATYFKASNFIHCFDFIILTIREFFNSRDTYLPQSTRQKFEDDVIQVETSSFEKSTKQNLIVFGQIIIVCTIPQTHI
jgi:hypothetical protein